LKKNVASQSIGVQMITAADGTAFAGAVSVNVAGDGGTPGAGGGTAPAHEGNGYHSYSPTQAETNFDHIAFIFTGTGAIPVTVQVFTAFPQAGDSFGRLGAPAGASVSADVAAVQARLPAALVGGRIDANISAINNATGGVSALDRSTRTMVEGTVDAGSSTTNITTSSLAPAAAVIDQFKGRIVIFDEDTTTANLRGQATDITGNTATGALTVTALTTAPVSGDTFVIV
jgi:hypothetical protein